MDLMVGLWVLFAALLFVIEPFIFARVAHRGAARASCWRYLCSPFLPQSGEAMGSFERPEPMCAYRKSQPSSMTIGTPP